MAADSAACTRFRLVVNQSLARVLARRAEQHLSAQQRRHICQALWLPFRAGRGAVG